MKSAFKGVVFWIGQKDVEVKVTVNKAMQLRQKCEQIQTSYTEKMKQVEASYLGKLQEVHGGYQKAMKKIQAMDHEQENLMKDKVELQEKYTEKSRCGSFHTWQGQNERSFIRIKFDVQVL